MQIDKEVIAVKTKSKLRSLNKYSTNSYVFKISFFKKILL